MKPSSFYPETMWDVVFFKINYYLKINNMSSLGRAVEAWIDRIVLLRQVRR